MEYFDFEFDFSQLDTLSLQKAKISFSEIEAGYFHSFSVWYDAEEYPRALNLYHFISFCSKSRFLRVYLTYTENKISILEVKVADEQEIRTYYCGQ